MFCIVKMIDGLTIAHIKKIYSSCLKSMKSFSSLVLNKSPQNKQYNVKIESKKHHIPKSEINTFYKFAINIGLSTHHIDTILENCNYDEKQSVVSIWQTILEHRCRTLHSNVMTVKSASLNPYRTRAVQ